MARLSATAVERGLRLFALSDSELGQWLAELHRDALELAACQVLGIDSIHTGPNMLAEPPESRKARDFVEYLTSKHLDAALEFNAGTPHALAIWLALRGDFERAGRALRKSGSYAALVKQARREQGDKRMRATKVDNQIKRVTKWARIGTEIRRAERGPRMNVSKLAEKIAAETGDSFNSIRLELPKLGLDPASWPETVKPRSRKKAIKKFSSRATLRK